MTFGLFVYYDIAMEKGICQIPLSNKNSSGVRYCMEYKEGHPFRCRRQDGCLSSGL